MAEHKNLKIEVKTEGDKGTFTGLLSTYGNIDQANDVCIKGCFDKDIALNGTRRPLLWQHNPDEPIGSFEIVDTEAALTIAGKFNLDVPQAQTAYALVKAGDIGGLSIGYSTEECTYDSEGHRLLQELKLYEGSVVTFPCNQQAIVTDVKGEKMTEDQIADLEKRLKSVEEELEKMRAKADDEDTETEDEEKEDPEEPENSGSEDGDEDEQKALLAAIEHLTATIDHKG